MEKEAPSILLSSFLEVSPAVPLHTPLHQFTINWVPSLC